MSVGPRIGAACSLVAAAVLLGGCIERNAYLELELRFPADADQAGARNAVVRVNEGDVSFDEDWQSTEALPAVKLAATEATKLDISVEGRPEIETKPVRIKVRFCRDPSCAAIDDDHAPEVRYEIERAFYLGERTSLTLTVACIPNVAGLTDPPPACSLGQDEQIEVPKCQVAGCREGVTSNYCVNGKHFCEP